MKYIKRNKLTVLVIVIFVLVVALGAYMYHTIFLGNKSEAYGNRLDGIESVKITSDQYKTIEEKLKDNANVLEVSTNLNGKIVNVIITVKDEVNKDTAKKIAAPVLKEFDKEQLAFYDIQIFVKKNNKELNDFPIVGYKQNGKEGLSWSKDRQVTTNEK